MAMSKDKKIKALSFLADEVHYWADSPDKELCQEALTELIADQKDIQTQE